MKTRKDITIHIGRSRRLLLWLCLIHGLMLLTLVSFTRFSLNSVVLIILLAASFIYYCRQYQWLKNERTIKKITKERDRWYIFQQDGTQTEPLRLVGCVVNQFVIILYFKAISMRQQKTVVLFADAVDKDELRKLRCYCRKVNIFLAE